MDEPEAELPAKPKGIHWPEFREWINVAVAATALIVAIVSFWTTTRVSGIEDFLRSEIKRRNTELNSLDDRAARLQKLANDRSDNLLRLQISTETMTAAALESQRKLLQSSGELADVRTNIIDAQRKLSLAEAQANSERARYLSQVDALDLVYRQEAYQELVSRAYMAAVFDEEEEERSPGKAIINMMDSVGPPKGREQLQSYFLTVRDRINNICPMLAGWHYELLKIAPEPAAPTITYRRGASPKVIAKLTKDAQDKWTVEFEAWQKSKADRSKSIIDQRDKLWKLTDDCVCRSLATDKQKTKDICPS